MIEFIAGAVVGWLIAHFYYLKSKGDAKSLQNATAREQAGQNTLPRFEYMLQDSKWTKYRSKSEERWICAANSMFTILVGDPYPQQFNEPWSDHFPNKNDNKLVPVYLQIYGTTIKEELFVAVDGWNYFVPLPQQTYVGGQQQYHWDRNGLRYRVGKVISCFHLDIDDLDGMAERCGIHLEAEARS